MQTFAVVQPDELVDVRASVVQICVILQIDLLVYGRSRIQPRAAGGHHGRVENRHQIAHLAFAVGWADCQIE
jgi:hypothetical protein